MGWAGLPLNGFIPQILHDVDNVPQPGGQNARATAAAGRTVEAMTPKKRWNSATGELEM